MPHVHDLLSREGRERVIQLYEELEQDSEFGNAMGQDLAILLAAIHHIIAPEG